jgi:hypothetical protein
MRADPVAVPLRVLVILGAQGRPLLGPLPALIIISIFTPPLMPPLCFFSRNVLCLSIQKEEGAVEYSFCKMDTPSVSKYLHPLTFTNHILPFVLLKKL